jgi:hypothetical protein
MERRGERSVEMGGQVAGQSGYRIVSEGRQPPAQAGFSFVDFLP